MSISSPLGLPSLLAAITTQPVHDALMPATAPTSQPLSSGAAAVFTMILLLTALVGAVLFFTFGVYRPRSVIGPNRLPARGKTGIVLISFFIGLFVWFAVQAVYGQRLMAELRHQGVEHPELKLSEAMSPATAAFLSTVPPLIAFGVMLVILLIGGRRLIGRLGLDVRKLPRGFGAGALAFIVIFPLVLLSNVPLESFYQHVKYTHPNEHELLNELGHAQNPMIVLVIGLGAMICAPLFEELLFRGHLQTLLRHLFAKFASRGAPQSVMAVEIESANPLTQVWMMTPPPPPPGVVAETLGNGSPAFPTLPELPKQRSAWPSWLAILITSLLFAAVHPLWMSPLIFVLSLGLGYIYERTGTLWASMTVHFLFNAVNTLQFYFVLRGGHGS